MQFAWTHHGRVHQPRTRGTNGITMALLAAALFSASTPLAKGFLSMTSPIRWQACCMRDRGWLERVARPASPSRGSCGGGRVQRGDAKWLAGSVAFGGILAPVLLMLGGLHAGGIGFVVVESRRRTDGRACRSCSAENVDRRI